MTSTILSTSIHSLLSTTFFDAITRVQIEWVTSNTFLIKILIKNCLDSVASLV